VVARDSLRRLLNRDGSFNVVRKGQGIRSALSLYYSLLTMSWPRFVLLAIVGYLVANALFAVAYLLCGPDALQGDLAATGGGRLARAFFFSVHTLSTIGYGHVVPASVGANVLVTIEAMVGLFGLALGTGLIFARFSRPLAEIIFSDKAVVAPYRGITAFEFRIVNRRRNQIMELEAKVHLAWLEESDGRLKRRFHQLSLERHKVTFFPLSWTIVHPIDEESPLYGVTREQLAASNAEILVLLTGIDETFSQTVHARSSYRAEEIVWGAAFTNIYERPSADASLAIDMGRIHDIEAV
jgi:inward rectifier potassium channel